MCSSDLIHSPVRTRVLLVLLAAAGFSALTACVPLVLGGAVATGTVVATDRRTSGTVVEDNAIQLKASNRISDSLGLVSSDGGDISLTVHGDALTVAALANVRTTDGGQSWSVQSQINPIAVAGAEGAALAAFGAHGVTAAVEMPGRCEAKSAATSARPRSARVGQIV